MKPPRTESRWARMKRWADEHEAWERGTSERRREWERHQEEAKQKAKAEEKRGQMLGLTMVGALFVSLWAIIVTYSAAHGHKSVGLHGTPILWFVSIIPALSGVPLLFLLVRLVLGRPRNLDEKLSIGCFSVLFGFLPSWLLCIQIALWANGALDAGPIRIVRTVVARKSTATSKGSTSYFLSLREWNPRREGGAPSLSVSPERYESTPEGAPVLVYTKPGLLGIEWIMDYSIR